MSRNFLPKEKLKTTSRAHMDPFLGFLSHSRPTLLGMKGGHRVAACRRLWIELG
jgi:hypothetical protein